MSFNDQVQNLSTSSGRRGVFKEGVKTKWLTGNQPILFRILPAYNYEDKDTAGNVNSSGFVTCRDASGALTSWGAIVKIARYIGHGHGKASNRRDFLSPRTFNNDDSTFCAITTLYATAANYPEWQYLIEDRRDAQKRLIERSALGNPSEFLAMNIVELSGGAMPEVVLGIATKSTTDSLVSPHKNGLLYQRANNVSPEQIQANPLCAWAIGDVTNPTNGPVLYVAKGQDKGDYSSYQVGLSVDPQNQVRHYPIDPSLLPQRYDLTNVKQVVDIKPDEVVVNELVKIFSMRAPSGHHEYELLKLAFGECFKIPDAPAAPMASSTVPVGIPGAPAAAGGFGPPPAAGAPQVAGPAVGAPPAAGPVGPVVPGGPAAVPAPATTPSVPPAGGPVAPAPAPVGAMPGAPVPGAPVPGPAATPPPADDQLPGLGGAPVAPPATTPSVAPGVDQTAQNAAAAGGPAAPAGAPVAPGDPVPGFNREEFLGDLRTGDGAQPPQQ